MDAYEHEVTSVALIPGAGGVFEVTIDDELIFSKKGLGRHAEPDEIIGLMHAR